MGVTNRGGTRPCLPFYFSSFLSLPLSLFPHPIPLFLPITRFLDLFSPVELSLPSFLAFPPLLTWRRPPQIQLGFGERCELLKWGSGQSSGRSGISVVIWDQKTCPMFVVDGVMESSSLSPPVPNPLPRSAHDLFSLWCWVNLCCVRRVEFSGVRDSICFSTLSADTGSVLSSKPSVRSLPRRADAVTIQRGQGTTGFSPNTPAHTPENWRSGTQSFNKKDRIYIIYATGG